MNLLEIYIITHLVCAFFAYGFLFAEMDCPVFRAKIEQKKGKMSDSMDYWTSMSASLLAAIIFGPMALALALALSGTRKGFKLF